LSLAGGLLQSRPNGRVLGARTEGTQRLLEKFHLNSVRTAPYVVSQPDLDLLL